MFIPGLALAGALTAPPEVRGTWLTTTANEAISSPSRTAATMKRLREIGLNTVYIECWKDGYTEFPSPTMRRITGVEMRVNPSPSGAIQRDLLAETVTEAHRHGLIAIAWFEYGFMAAHQGTQNHLRRQRDWLSLDSKGGDLAKNGFAWMNPLHPEAQTLLLSIVKEAIRAYDLDGIQLDDRIVWPSLEMGYDDFTRKLYAQENGGAAIPENPRDPAWMAWRQMKVEAFAKRFVREVREAAGPDFIISLSPGPHPWALENYLIDWPAWSRWSDGPTWDEYIPQVYRMNYPSFERDWKQQAAFMGDRAKDTIAGIRLVGDGPDADRATVARHAELVRETAGGGHVWWFSRGVLDLFSEEIASLYRVKELGQAPHPRFGSGRRPPPLRAEPAPDGSWTIQPPPGRYRVIAQFSGSWHEIRRVASRPGEPLRIKAPGAQAIELLVDRRPAKDAL